MWLHSSQFRQSNAYALAMAPGHPSGHGTADAACVSRHHDVDYCQFELAGYEAYCAADGRNVYMHAWRKALEDSRYWQVGTTFDDLVQLRVQQPAGLQCAA
jgi:hypothetical protein